MSSHTHGGGLMTPDVRGRALQGGDVSARDIRPAADGGRIREPPGRRPPSSGVSYNGHLSQIHRSTSAL